MLRGYTLFDHARSGATPRGVAFIERGLAEGALKPITAKTFPIEEIVEAHRYMESNEGIGKIVVTVEKAQRAPRANPRANDDIRIDACTQVRQRDSPHERIMTRAGMAGAGSQYHRFQRGERLRPSSPHRNGSARPRSDMTNALSAGSPNRLMRPLLKCSKILLAMGRSPHARNKTSEGLREWDVHISIYQGGLARLLARKWKLFGVDNEQVTALAFPRPEVRTVRLDPARGIVEDMWWKSARNPDAMDLVAGAQGAPIDRLSGATTEAGPGSRGYDLQLVEPPCGTLQRFGSQHSPQQHEVMSAPAAGGDKERDLWLLAPAPRPDEAGWRLQRWAVLLLRVFRHLHLFPVRLGKANVIPSLLFRQKALPSTEGEPAERNEEFTGAVRPAEINVPVMDDATEDHFLEPPRCSEAMLSEAVSVIGNANEPVAAGSCETPSIVEVTGQANAKKLLGLGPGEPVFLFAGEMSYAAGVDILTDALITVCQGHQGAQFVLIGLGPLRNDMEAQVSTAGFAHRCRFTGDLPPATFELMLAACDAVVIPAREHQNSELADRAHTLGKPVLTTHQAQLRGVVHGLNGLVAYDCANSLVWGLRELIAQPLHLHPQQGSVERQAA